MEMKIMQHKISYIVNGTLADFPFSFPFFQPGDVRVAIDNIVLDGNQFSIAANENLDGGIISFAAAPAAGCRIDIFRKILLERAIDYQPTQKINPEHLNRDFNFLMEALRDRDIAEINSAAWQNTYDNVLALAGQLENIVSGFDDYGLL
ncbi:MAG: hypothetical protein LBJ18_02705 [Rickettsiales bacterium]|jgi:hypothetical protein|nr:hypothetical protein [Rickettsiales bacterium]